MGKPYKDGKRRAGIYLENLISSPLIGIINGGLDATIKLCLTNTAGAVFYGGLDILGGFSDKIRESKFTRVSKLIGAAYFGGFTTFDLVSIAVGDYNAAVNLLFDAPMTYQLVKDNFDYYGQPGKELLDDFSFIKNL